MALNEENVIIGDIINICLEENLTRTRIVQYAGASGDYNPLHTDEIFATQVAGQKSVFAHGLLLMGMCGKAVTDYVGDGRLRKFGVRFTKQAFPGDALYARLEVKDIHEENGEKLIELDIAVTNQNEETVLTGYATAVINERLSKKGVS
ncbi:MAG TPA: MaoC/PaaZ C-terminal domain-containing protein [Syntrophomonas sp.]|nr:MaoC/PaaZ C-terminal domain-containing protein [Syntrophomonas sp.]